MIELNPHDLQFAIRRLPKPLVDLMKDEDQPLTMVGGGYLRTIVAGEYINDIDCFCASKRDALKVAEALSVSGRSGGGKTRRIHETDNAFTVLDYKPVIQIIHRWNFTGLGSLIRSFDFTCCAAAFAYTSLHADGPLGWRSVCDEDFYPSIAAKRLEYTSPMRDEEAGGSTLRVLKYYSKGYKIPLDSFAKVLARLVKGVSQDNRELWQDLAEGEELPLARVLCGLLREVDPDIDPKHASHLPAAADFANEGSHDV